MAQKNLQEEEVRDIISQSLSNMVEVLRVRNKIIVGDKNRIILDGPTGQIQFYNGSQKYGYIVTDPSLNMYYLANNSHYFWDNSGNYIGRLFHDSASSYGLELLGGSKIQFTSGSTITDTGSTLGIDRTLTVNGDVALTSGKKFQIGTTAGVTFSSDNVGGLFEMNAVGGIITYWHKF